MDPFLTLEELDFADDLVLVSRTHQHMREDHPSQHVCTTCKPEVQPKEDSSDDAECPKPLAIQSKWRRSSKN